jgi:hypothetical protein
MPPEPALPFEKSTERRRFPARRLQVKLAGLFVADGDGFETRPVESVEVDLEGLVVPGLRGERHRGHSRGADARTPWYPRGTRIRNSRQISIVSAEELVEIAKRMKIPEVRPEWIGANLVFEGLPDLTAVARGTRLHFPGQACIAVEDENAPCRHAGGAVAARYDGVPGLDLAFVAAARHRRGVVAWIERPGIIKAGDTVEFRIPEQWIY